MSSNTPLPEPSSPLTPDSETPIINLNNLLVSLLSQAGKEAALQHLVYDSSCISEAFKLMASPGTSAKNKRKQAFAVWLLLLHYSKQLQINSSVLSEHIHQHMQKIANFVTLKSFLTPAGLAFAENNMSEFEAKYSDPNVVLLFTPNKYIQERRLYQLSLSQLCFMLQEGKVDQLPDPKTCQIFFKLSDRASKPTKVLKPILKSSLNIGIGEFSEESVALRCSELESKSFAPERKFPCAECNQPAWGESLIQDQDLLLSLEIPNSPSKSSKSTKSISSPRKGSPRMVCFSDLQSRNGQQHDSNFSNSSISSVIESTNEGSYKELQQTKCQDIHPAPVSSIKQELPAEASPKTRNTGDQSQFSGALANKCSREKANVGREKFNLQNKIKICVSAPESSKGLLELKVEQETTEDDVPRIKLGKYLPIGPLSKQK